ncbi:hypothetical protein MYXO_01913 [Myxococcaceae bacterium]|nr:hypothetical protein MYXO_01913 [Myxococcaceae bacterium]
MHCIADAWERHETELRGFLRRRARSDAEAEDLLQEVFLRALRQKNGLCGIDNPRAWLESPAYGRSRLRSHGDWS